MCHTWDNKESEKIESYESHNAFSVCRNVNFMVFTFLSQRLIINIEIKMWDIKEFKLFVECFGIFSFNPDLYLFFILILILQKHKNSVKTKVFKQILA